jgi:hypothetical protein
MSRKANKKQMLMTRRQALAACGVGAGAAALLPGFSLMQGLVDGIIGKAMAAGTGIAPRSVINYHLAGAPNRWYWDLPLSPYANANPVATPLTGNRIVNGLPAYATTPFAANGSGTIYLPYLWASQIPTSASSTSTVAMTELAKNMLLIRGISGTSASHPDGAREKTHPNATVPSLLGTVADASSLPIQSAIIGDYSMPFEAFAAKHSAQTQARNMSAPLADLLKPFNKSLDNYGSTFVSRRAAMDTLVQRGLASLGAFSASNLPGSDSLFSMRNSAELLMKNGVTTALNAYPAALAKYKSLISRCATLGQIGISDVPVPLPSAGTYGVNEATITGGNPVYCQNSDLRTIITSSTYPTNMAEGFAVAEILVTQGLSNSVNIGSSYMNLLNFQGVANYGDKSLVAPASEWHWDHDQHNSGSITSLLTNAFMFQSLAACIYELAMTLNAKGLWSESLIFVSSDFGRNVRTGVGAAGSGSQSGSDHDPSSCNYSIFSGAIATPSVIGNTGTTPNSNGYSGDCGQNRPISNIFGANRSLIPADAVSSIASLARVASPLENNPSLVDATGTPLIEKATEKA